MIQLKVCSFPPYHPLYLPLLTIPPDDAQLHRQLWRFNSRMRRQPPDEAPCKNRYPSYPNPLPSDLPTNPPQGDRIIVVVQKQKSYIESVGGGSAGAQAANKVRRGDIRHAIVVRTAKKLQRKDGMVVRFDDNACVLINKAGEPIGTRLTSMLLSALAWGLRLPWQQMLGQLPVMY